jgi:hypothetical protein
LQPPDELHRLAAVRRLADDLQVRVEAEHDRDQLPERRLVVANDDAAAAVFAHVDDRTAPRRLKPLSCHAAEFSVVDEVGG